MSNRIAACACGQLRVTCAGEPERVSMCHCNQCQKRTGTAFGIAAFYNRDKIVSIEGVATKFVRGSDSGNRIAFHFCPTCGSTVYIEPESRPNIVAVAVGAFADPKFPQPVQSVWTDRKHDWLLLPDDVKVFSAGPAARPAS